jgi:hypothetical protein
LSQSEPVSSISQSSIISSRVVVVVLGRVFYICRTTKGRRATLRRFSGLLDDLSLEFCKEEGKKGKQHTMKEERKRTNTKRAASVLEKD